MSNPPDKQDWLQIRARELRKEATQPERILWRALRNRRLCKLKFLRQCVIDEFVVDFVCREQKLIIEIDGDSHAERAAKDFLREQRLKADGYRVFRVSNDDVLTNLEGVLIGIVAAAGIDPAKWRDGFVD
ncbi:endonuclease domain-containing protein [Planctomicrobium piriforme]|uniref:Very-short-patch-repair endonuclease n=1 Tax=Planctomicrobium piriforme TaxID=1576369 RepID=A0A1I3AX75_9PLAN|nr:DUF559 domain-containing protein [Planctomicrobium piriforme]SFH54550.1 Very-short-patch-repair endonuclease [Planctomicrobium piriforme]